MAHRNRNIAPDDLSLTPPSPEAASVQAGAVGTAQVADDAITTDKIADDAITTDKIADDAITTDKITDDAITTDKIADDAVDLDQMAHGPVGSMLAFDDGLPVYLPVSQVEGVVSTTLGATRPTNPRRGHIHLFSGLGPLRGHEDPSERIAILAGRKAIAADATRLFVDSGRNARGQFVYGPGTRIEVYDHDGVAQASEVITLSALSWTLIHRIADIDVTADRLFVLDDNGGAGVDRRHVHVFARAGGAHQAREDITLDSANRDVVGLAVTATRVYVLDRSDNKVYAYNRAGGAHQASEDIELVGLPNVAESFLARDEERFFLSQGRQVLVFDFDGNLQPKESFDFEGLFPVTAISGLAVANDTLFLANQSGSHVRQHPLYKDGDIVNYTDRWHRFEMAAN